jgi:hypothetical protein
MKRLITILLLIITNIMSSTVGYAYSFSSTSKVLTAGNTSRVKVTDDNGNEVVGTWKSKDTDIARVDNEGNVTAISAGKTKITFDDGKNFEKDIEISVKDSKREYYNNMYMVRELGDADDPYTVLNAIQPGVYIVLKDGDDANVTIETDNDENILGIKYNSAVKYNTIIKVEDGDIIRQNHCKLVSLDSELDTTGSGVFIVGTHVPAGDYAIETDNCKEGTVEVYSDVSYKECLLALPVEQKKPQSVSLKDGNIIVLNGAKLCNM